MKQFSSFIVNVVALLATAALMTLALAQPATQPERKPAPPKAEPLHTLLAELEGRLKPVVQAAQPGSLFIHHFSGSYLIIKYWMPERKEHIDFYYGQQRKGEEEKWGKEFNEVLIYLSIERDNQHYTPARSREYLEDYGTTFLARYGIKPVKVVPDRIMEDLYVQPWTFYALKRLVAAGLADSEQLNDRMLLQGYRNRYEWAITFLRAERQFNERMNLKEKQPQLTKPRGTQAEPPPTDTELTQIFQAARCEFTPELQKMNYPLTEGGCPDILGYTYHKPEEYIKMRFSYGRGVDPKLIEQVKQTVKEFAAEKWAAQK